MREQRRDDLQARDGLTVFLTVGTQLPFDRLVSAVDAWAAGHPRARVFGQIGPSRLPASAVRHIEHVPFVPAPVCRERVRWADVVVAHAGMGSILTAIDARTPVVIVPRLASLGEHRNEHQLATARHLAGRPGVRVADDLADLPALIESSVTSSGFAPEHAREADASLMACLRRFMAAGPAAELGLEPAGALATPRPAGLHRHHDASTL